jgi:hypothetical protein
MFIYERPRSNGRSARNNALRWLNWLEKPNDYIAVQKFTADNPL